MQSGDGSLVLRRSRNLRYKLYSAGKDFTKRNNWKIKNDATKATISLDLIRLLNLWGSPILLSFPNNYKSLVEFQNRISCAKKIAFLNLKSLSKIFSKTFLALFRDYLHRDSWWGSRVLFLSIFLRVYEEYSRVFWWWLIVVLCELDLCPRKL